MPESEGRTGRLRALIGVIALHGLVLVAVLLSPPSLMTGSQEELRTFDVARDDPPPAMEPMPGDLAPEAEAEPGDRAEPTQVVAPEPVVVLDAPQPVRIAPVAGQGTEAASGAAVGNGSGAGGEGSGSGGGGSITRAVLASGRITAADYPRAAAKARAEGTSTVRFTIDPFGRPSGCRVVRTSGHALLDTATCRLIEERFRYEPARDTRGNTVEDVAGWQQRWWLE
jgi:periplasmic protein TonB